MREKHEKTNAMRALDRVKASYTTHSYGDGEAVSGVEVASMLGQDARRVFKTLVAEELDLKKAAACVGEKALSMLKSKELLPLTGYVHGGCSPIGMKKPFRTVAHETARNFDTILFSAGKIGLQIETSLANLQKAMPVELADIIVS